ncbi:copper transport protein ATX1-like [Primulina eburnea]|uniref:copper transport protein ATX1-like n=1 Tax=Primulina eburnea TaxID=1245227 RepID=UPI003C6C3561
MSETVVLKVKMSCQGCVGAVNRVLSKMEGVESFDINLEQQKVTVKGNVKPESVLQTVSKTGKVTSLWEANEAKPENVSKPNDPLAKTEPVSKPNDPVAKPEPVSKPNDPKAMAESGSKSTDAVAAA